jgi:hypothetical protein
MPPAGLRAIWKLAPRSFARFGPLSSESRVALLRVDSCVLGILGFRSPDRANVASHGTRPAGSPKFIVA